ncbi:MAG: cysteine desulfurase family protein [Cardiobacteriaceae bacterium]|nr:cysteine desulfurase family protein [Cardiobacteriaceae bacterium]
MQAYFDYSATTPLDSRVKALLMEAFDHAFNAGATYPSALVQRQYLESARQDFATSIGADSREVVFLSGATEANNLAIKGAVSHHEAKNPRVITVQTEHKAVLDPVGILAKSGVKTEFLPVLPLGLLDLDVLAKALSGVKTTLVSVMAVNNETGVVQDIRAIADVVHEHGAKLHVDAAQALGKMRVDVRAWDADMVSFSGHKVYAPMGIGALYVRRLPKMRLQAMQHGGGQERGLRSGTSPVPLIRAFALATQLAQEEHEMRLARVEALSKALCDNLPTGITRHVSHQQKVPHIENLALPINAQSALAQAAQMGIALSAGSACQSGNGASHVLQAMGLETASAGLRVSLSHLTTDSELKALLHFLNHLVNP